MGKMNDWQTFRKSCRNRKDTHGSHDLCVTIDEKHIVQAYHGECTEGLCPANWRKAVKNEQN
jgi:hypothetical protein